MIKNLINKIKNYFKNQSSQGTYLEEPFHPQNKIWINNFWKSDYKKSKYLGSYKTSSFSHPSPDNELDYEYVDIYFCPIMKKIYAIYKDIIYDYSLSSIPHYYFSQPIQDKINRLKLLL